MYDHKHIEQKWQNYWKQNKTFRFRDCHNQPKMYLLDMFPYPSAKGLHVGHPKGYVATDVLSRYYRLKGYSVLHPIGWDAFGLPAEQFALDSGKHPAPFTLKNIDRFRQQLISLGFDFDYDKEVNTTDPNYYRWTQWIFVQLYKHGLAQIQAIDVNWCEQLKCVLSNEEVVVNEKCECVSERGGFKVVKRPMKQWVLKITAYADQLLDGLEELNWPESLKAIQRHWIGRKEGLVIKFGTDKILPVFTPRADLVFGVSFLAISPKHPDLWNLVTLKQKDSVNQFLTHYSNQNDLYRQKNQELNGVFSGTSLLNPFTKKLVPVWITDYVPVSFEDNALMGTPAHNEDDFRFSQKYGLDIPFVITTEHTNKPFLGNGPHVNSGFLNGLNNHEAMRKVAEFVQKNRLGFKHVIYKLRDWVFSRQRYWGEPFPVLFDDQNQIKVVEDLPVVLPEIDTISLSGTGESPLANLVDWVNVTINGVHYRRDTNTMPQWAGSCWYYLGYLMKQADGSYLALNSSEAKKLFERWLPVDVYVGGQEHAVLHLLYARFWHRFLYDLGVVPTKEPFQKIINQGMILGPDGTKMSKSKGNVINPDDIIRSHGADALRLYEMFMGPVTASFVWSSAELSSMRRWLDRVYRLFETSEKFVSDPQLISVQHEDEYNRLIRDFTANVEKQHFNLCISAMMVFINNCYQEKHVLAEYLDNFLILLSCFAPHLAEELYAKNHPNQSVCLQKLPQINQQRTVSQWTIPVQINGRFYATINVGNLTQDEILALAKNEPKIKKILADKTIVKEVYVSKKIINFVVK